MTKATSQPITTRTTKQLVKQRTDKPDKVRIDELLSARGLTLALARAKIMAGKVYVDEQKVASPALRVAPTADIQVRASKRYVSRGGKKLETACKSLSVSVRGKNILDIGSSTGGFTDYCLQHGAKKVIAVDVGTAQLAWLLRQDVRVQSFEKTDVRNLPPDCYHGIDLVLADVSFISLTTIMPAVFAQLKQTEYLVLIKPQFEIPRQLVPRGGIVSNNRHRQYALERVQETFCKNGFTHLRSVDSQVLGAKGNQEFFLYAK